MIGEIPPSFNLNTSLDYKTTSLDLYGTCRSDDRNRLDPKKMVTLVMAMGRTSLKTSLKRVHVSAEEVSAKHIQKIFHKYDFDVTVYGDNSQPDEL